MENVTADNVHPKLRPLVQAFLLRCKYQYNIINYGRLTRIETPQGTEYMNDTVLFFDPQATTLNHVGGLRWVDTNDKFRVITRKEQNKRFKDRERRMSVETADENKALREMLKHITPYTINELARTHFTEAQATVGVWRNEFEPEMAKAFELPTRVLVEELHNLKAQGCRFVTPQFQAAVEAGLKLFEESEKRRNAVLRAHFVRVLAGGTYEVLSPDVHDNKLRGNTTTYLVFEDLPEFMRETIAMLQILKDNTRIPGVGSRIGADGFWVLEHDEQKA